MWSYQHQGVCTPIKNPCQVASWPSYQWGKGDTCTFSHVMRRVPSLIWWGVPCFIKLMGVGSGSICPLVCAPTLNSEKSESTTQVLPSTDRTTKRSLRNQEGKVRTHLRSQWEAADCHSASDGNPFQWSFYPCRKTNNSKISCVILVSFVDTDFSAHWLSSTGKHTQTTKDNL